MLQTVSFRSAELCVGISCLLAKSEPQNHFPLRHSVTPPQTGRQTHQQADGGPIQFRAISSSPSSRLSNTHSPLHEKLLIPIINIFFFFYNVQYKPNMFYDLNSIQTSFLLEKICLLLWTDSLFELTLETF